LKRAEKEAFVSDLQKSVGGAQALALLSFNKLNAEQFSNFRLTLRKKGLRVKVVKNTLAKRVFDATPYKELSDQLTGPVLMAYGDGDPVTAAKAIWEWVSIENFDVQVRGGVALGQVMSKDQIGALSKLPGKNELLVSFLWCLKSGPTGFLNAVQDMPRKLGYALGALKDKKEKEGGGAPAPAA
jgi:large subunit ribosomal protein L10